MLAAGTRAHAFNLTTLDGKSIELAPEASGPTLIAFFATDCPTCQLAFPYLDRIYGLVEAAGGRVIGISQDGPGATGAFVEQTGIEMPVVLDKDLAVTRQYDPVSVPTLFVIDGDFNIARTEIGFSKATLNSVASTMASAVGVEAKTVAPAHDGAPETKPGCGSRHLEAGMEAGGAEVEVTGAYVAKGKRASRIELPDDVDPYDYCREQGFSDPLPVIPPTVERVEKFLAATVHPPDEVIARVSPNYGPATVEKIAANAVMAGCPPELMPTLLTMVRALCDEKFNMHGVLATTHFAWPLILINGPARNDLGFHYKKNVMSNVARANSTLGRALSLIVANIGGGRPDGIDMSALGNPGKFSYCIAENEERSPWEPFHVSEGFDASESTLTLFAGEPPACVSEHNTKNPKTILRAIVHPLANLWTRRACIMMEAFVLIGPEHADTLHAGGMSKEDVRNWLFENTGIPIAEYETEEAKDSEGMQFAPMYPKTEIDGVACYRKFRAPSSIKIVVTGGTAGKFSAVIGSWLTGPRGSDMVTYPIAD